MYYNAMMEDVLKSPEFDKEQLDYMYFVQTRRISRSNEVIKNKNKAFAGIIFAELVKSAKKQVNIYSNALNIDVISYYVKELLTFVAKGGNLTIICENEPIKDNPIFVLDKIFKVLSIKDAGKIQLYFNVGQKMNFHNGNHYHFATFDNTGYRLETDIESRRADACFNDPETTSDLIEIFNRIKFQVA